MDYSAIAVMGSFVGMLLGIWRIAAAFRTDIDRVFERFDEHKGKVDERLLFQVKIDADTYMRKENCDLTQKIYATEIVGLKEEVRKMNLKLDRLLENWKAQ